VKHRVIQPSSSLELLALMVAGFLHDSARETAVLTDRCARARSSRVAK